MRKNPHNQKVPRATQILEVIHSDIIGPLNESINGYRFIITFIDERSGKGLSNWGFGLKITRSTQRLNYNLKKVRK